MQPSVCRFCLVSLCGVVVLKSYFSSVHDAVMLVVILLMLVFVLCSWQLNIQRKYVTFCSLFLELLASHCRWLAIVIHEVTMQSTISAVLAITVLVINVHVVLRERMRVTRGIIIQNSGNLCCRWYSVTKFLLTSFEYCRSLYCCLKKMLYEVLTCSSVLSVCLFCIKKIVCVFNSV